MICGMPRPTNVRIRNAARAALLATATLAWLAPEAWSQSAGFNRRSANGRDFPSWEREVDTSIPAPLPTARQGRHVLDLSIPLEAPATGVVRLLRGGLVAPLIDGRVQVVDLEGELLAQVELGAEEPWPPVGAGELALVGAGRTLAAVGRDGEAWRVELAGEVAWPPVLRPAGLALTLRGGGLELVEPESGRRAWSVVEEAQLSCGPAQSAGLLVWGTADGRLVARRVEDGSAAWSIEVGEVVTSVAADAGGVYFVARGRTGRSKRATGPFLGRAALRSGRAPDLSWRFRVGGTSDVEPLLLGPFVAFPSHDGYLHALERENGQLAWRTGRSFRTRTRPSSVRSRRVGATPWPRRASDAWSACVGSTRTPAEPHAGSRRVAALVARRHRLPLRRDLANLEAAAAHEELVHLGLAGKDGSELFAARLPLVLAVTHVVTQVALSRSAVRHVIPSTLSSSRRRPRRDFGRTRGEGFPAARGMIGR
jgi:hypothetical protein